MLPNQNHLVLEPDAISLLATYGIPYPPHAMARNASEAAKAASHLGYPVVLKVVSPQVIHKSEVGGVTVGLKGPKQVRDAFKEMVSVILERVPDAEILGTLVCQQAPEGFEVIIGALKDINFGSTVVVGMGGIFTEIFNDKSFRIAPVSSLDIKEMLKELRGYPLLIGTRGRPGYDLGALTNLLLAVSRMVTERPDVVEMDLNPVRLYRNGATVLDARIILQGD